VKLIKIPLVLAMSGLSSIYTFAQQAIEYTQDKKIKHTSVTVEKNHRLNAYSSRTSTMSNLNEVPQ
jgi:hypothetical protein